MEDPHGTTLLFLSQVLPLNYLLPPIEWIPIDRNAHSIHIVVVLIMEKTTKFVDWEIVCSKPTFHEVVIESSRHLTNIPLPYLPHPIQRPMNLESFLA